MPVTIQILESLFERYGWNTFKKDEQTLLVGFQGKNKEFVVSARLMNDWLAMTVADYLPDTAPERQNEVNRYLLDLNSQVFFCRFGLTKENKILVTVDLPAFQKIEYELFASALDILSFYVDDSYPHLYKKITGQEPLAGTA